MKRGLFLIFFVTISFIILTSCQLFDSQRGYITEKDSGKVYSFEEGEYFSVELDSSPKAGYLWDILPYNENVINFINSKFVKDGELQGKRIIRFKAVAEGKTDLRLIYYKIWEKSKKPVKKINFEIIVD